MAQHCSKAALDRSLSYMRHLFPYEYDFFPRSWNVKTHFKQFCRDYDSSKTYIIKPSFGKQGDGIYLFQKFNEFVRIVEGHPSDNLIVQEYVDNPMLLGGYKFDMRVYVMIESLDPFVIHVFRDGLTRLCTEQYSAPTQSNLGDAYMHLTNYSLNKKHTDFKSNNTDNGEGIHDTSSKRSIETMLAQLNEAGLDVEPEEFWKDVEGLASKTLIAMWGDMWGTYSAAFPRHNTGGTYGGRNRATTTTTDKTADVQNKNKKRRSTRYNPHVRPHTASTSSKRSQRQPPQHNGDCFCENAQPKLPRSYGFHIVGLDIMMDAEGHLWLLEANAAPSMATGSPLDLRIKRSLIERSLDIIGVIPTAKEQADAKEAAAAARAAARPKSAARQRGLRDVNASGNNKLNSRSAAAAAAAARKKNSILNLSSWERLTGSSKEKRPGSARPKNRPINFDWTDLECKKVRPDILFEDLHWYSSRTLQCMFNHFSSKATGQKRGLTPVVFSRFCYVHGVIGKGMPMTIAELDLMYIKLLRNHQERTLTFPLFAKALLIVAKKKFPKEHTVQAFKQLMLKIEGKQATEQHTRTSAVNPNSPSVSGRKRYHVQTRVGDTKGPSTTDTAELTAAEAVPFGKTLADDLAMTSFKKATQVIIKKDTTNSSAAPSVFTAYPESPDANTRILASVAWVPSSTTAEPKTAIVH
jgi:hypothetical protein